MKLSTLRTFFVILVLAYCGVVARHYYKRGSVLEPNQQTAVEQPAKDNEDVVKVEPVPTREPADEQVTEPTPKTRQPLVVDLSSWAYWLKGVDLDKLESSKVDLVVVDTEINSRSRFGRSDVARLKDSGKKVLAFLSIGEAENYRQYWKALNWGDGKPEWIGQQNPLWKGVFSVEQPLNKDWMAIVYSQIDQIKSAGFDGVVFGGLESYQNKKTRDQMSTLVQKSSEYAKKNNFDSFIIIMQDALEIAQDEQVLEAIDGVIKQDLVFSWKSNGVSGPRNPISETNKHLEILDKIKSSGKAVLVVEYISGKNWEVAKEIINQHGFVGISAPRELNLLRSR